MPHRDPDTGQFLAHDDAYDDVEVVTWYQSVVVTAGDLDANASLNYPEPADPTFSGVELVDYDEVVDRNETLHLLRAQHRLSVYANSTATEDGSIRGAVEISTSPALQSVFDLDATERMPISDRTDVRRFNGVSTEDSIDLIGRPLEGQATAPFSDDSTGTSGGGSSGEDSYSLDGFTDPVARMHPRDELFLNGVLEASNITDQAIHMDVVGQHVYGVLDE